MSPVRQIKTGHRNKCLLNLDVVFTMFLVFEETRLHLS